MMLARSKIDNTQLVKKAGTAVVLSAYNGRRYIVEQLESLRRQSEPPDRVVVADDCSTDGTPDIVREYISGRGLGGWEFLSNGRNLGWRRSFHDLITSAGAEYVFPCDQDDVWHPDKVGVMRGVMDAHPEIDLLACSVAPFYEKGSKKTTAGAEEKPGGPEDALRPLPVGAGLMYVLRPGCTFCVRGTFVREAEPYWDPDRPHDEVLWQLAALKGTLFLLDKRLVGFRRHAGNASDRKKLDRAARIEQVDYFLNSVGTMERFVAEGHAVSEEAAKTLAEMRVWLTARGAFLAGDSRAGNIGKVVRNRGFYPTRRGLAVDLLLGLVPGLALT